ncbi:hypothetical protein LZZ90_12760 [Flavobacterium sp. SM15]|uniref:hypothetical protein n=1 Tax=Flavobacterium sp. SM15 TaxID=2908005 RepID=UPI001EDA85DC|nr:hypothetical protein [Flavobacterium sp. SM15]MCG2612379.1 hypothetical protein [Flavobacterium sp. SM15]
MKTPFLKTVLLFVVMSITLAAYPLSKEIDPITTNNNPKTEDVRGQQLVERLKEIKAMDKSEMSRSEKKELRKEVKAIKKELAMSHNGIYLSVGAIIIIILLLILLV